MTMLLTAETAVKIASNAGIPDSVNTIELMKIIVKKHDRKATHFEYTSLLTTHPFTLITFTVLGCSS